MEKFLLKTNDELEGWDVIERDGIQSEEGVEDSVVATFYEKDKAFKYLGTLNNK